MGTTSELHYKNVVIIGAISGVLLTRFLKNKLPKDHRLVLIDRQLELFYPIPALRAAVVPGWEDKVHSPFVDLFGKGSRHVVLPRTEVVELKEKAVLVDVAHEEKGFGYEIPFEYCVLAMGASQSIPARAPGRTGAGISEYFKRTQRIIASATNVLVVGGGPASIEFATEVRDYHPHAGVTLVQRSDRLARSCPGVHEKVLPVLNRMGIQVILEDQIVWPEGYVPGETGGSEKVFKTMKGKEIKAEYVYDGTGNKPNSALVFAVDPSAVAENGCVHVKPTMEVDSPRMKYYFVIGDLADVPEIKILGGANFHASVVATNVLSLLASRPATKKHTPHVSAGIITLGLKNGVFYSPIWTFTGGFAALLQGDLHASQWQTLYKARG